MKNNKKWRIIAMITSFLTLGFIVIAAYAHSPHDQVRGLGISPNFANDKTLFVAVEGERTSVHYENILRSTDGGATWIKLPRGMDNRFNFSAIRVSPNYSNDKTVFATTLGDGVYRSVNRGNSWQLFNTGIANKYLKGNLEIAKVGSTDYVLFLAPGHGELYRRSSSETSWIKLLGTTAGVSIVAVSPNFAQNTTVMTASTSGNLQVSIDGANNWVDRGNPTGAITYGIAIAPGPTREIFLATSSGVFYSNDLGITFTNRSTNLPDETINNIAVSPNYNTDGTLFCTTQTKAVYKSTDRGNSWVLNDSGAVITGQTDALNEFSELQISPTFSADQAVFLSAFDGLFISTNGGINWTEKQTRKNLITGLAFSPNFMDDQRIIATAYNSESGFYTSSDKGATWSTGSAGWPNPFGAPLDGIDVDFVQNRVGPPLAVATKIGRQIGFSSNSGESWDVLPIPQFPPLSDLVYINVFAVSPAFDSDQEIYIGTRLHGILHTNDGGINWHNVPDFPLSPHVTSIAVSPNYANDKTAFAANRSGDVWRTKNGGENWSQIGSDSIVINGQQSFMWIAISPEFITDRLIFVGTNNGVYRSGNGGDSWKPLLHSNVGPSTVIEQIEFSPAFAEDRTIFVTVRGKGLYRVSLNNAGWITTMQNMGTSLLGKNVQFIEFRISPNFKQDNTLIGASKDELYISTDRGLTWSLTGSPVQ